MSVTCSTTTQPPHKQKYNMTFTIQSSPWLLSAVAQDRITGCLIGSALGDAIGLYTEFLTAGDAQKKYPSGKFTLIGSTPTPFCRDSHRASHQPGNWTDDTDQAMCILLSYLHNHHHRHHHHSDGKTVAGENGGFTPQDFAKRLTVWTNQGLRALDTLPLGLGFTIGSITKRKGYEADPIGYALDYWLAKPKGLGKPAPNGSLMRTHPLGLICAADDPDEKQGEGKMRWATYELAAEFSCTTHVDPRCVVSCAIGTELIARLSKGEVTKEEHIDLVVGDVVEWYNLVWKGKMAKLARTRTIASTSSGEGEDTDDSDWNLDVGELNRHVRASSLADLELDEPGKIGYVYKTLGSGVVLLRQTLRERHGTKHQYRTLSSQLGIFERCITELVMCGGDADTNACFAGALLGALLGYKLLPGHWRDGLRHGDWLMGKADGLCDVLGVYGDEGCHYRGADDKDTAPDGGRGFLSAEDMDKRWKAHVQWIVQQKAKFDAEEAREKKKQTETGWKTALGFGSK